MGLIADRLPALFRARFPQIALATPDDPDVFLGELTHGHFSVYQRATSPEDVARQVCEQLLDFIEALTRDRVMVWSSGAGGGWRCLESGGPRDLPPNARAFLWSGPLR
jgi:hypothetical protein